MLVTEVGFEPTLPKKLVPKTSALDHSAIQPLPLYKICSYRGSNPGPSAHKTEALPTAPQEHWSVKEVPPVGIEPTTLGL